MKHRMLFAAILLVFAFSLSACRSIEADKESEYISIGALVESEVNKSNDIRLTVKDGTLTPTCATFLLTNASTDDAYFGSAFELHKKENDGWHYLLYQEDNVGWTAIRNILRAGSTVEIEQQWETLYGTLSNGNYRFVKKVWFEEKTTIPERDLTVQNDQYTLSAEFDIS